MMRAGRSALPESLSNTKGSETSLSTAPADAAAGRLSVGRRTTTLSSESGVSSARYVESSAIPPTSVNRVPARRSESRRAIASIGPSGVRAWIRAIPPCAAASARGSPGSSRSYSLRKCPELTMRP